MKPREVTWISVACAVLLALAFGCGGSPVPDDNGVIDGEWKNLAPVPNPKTDAPNQPRRYNPYAVAMTQDGKTALVTLRGSELDPGDQVVVIDVASRSVAGRVSVGSRPHAIRMWPGGDFAVVLSQFSRFAAVIDVSSRRVVSKFELGYYARQLVFSSDGGWMYVTNRGSDEVEKWRVSALGGGLAAERVANTPAGANPAALALDEASGKLYVVDRGGLGIRVFSADTLEETTKILMDAPVFDLAVMGKWIVATTLNDTRGLPCEDDGDYVGTQGDGVFPIVTDRTCGRGFSDIQNEIAFIDPATDQIAIRYTSDSAEVSEADREGDYDPALMQVVGALPVSIAVVRPTRAYVVMAASNQLVDLSLDAGEPPIMTMPRTWDLGLTPHGLAVDQTGDIAVVANKLGESVTILNLATGDRADIQIDADAPAFPATSAEVGEMFFQSARFSTDGDQSCTHCHPDVDTDAKGWGVDIVRAFGRRATLPIRNLHETQPLLVEGVFDENDFSLEMEGISFRPDFHDSSYTLQVQRRDEFYREVSRELIGREVSFDQMVSNVAAFLVIEPRLLPSPFDRTTPQVERGKALFERPDVGCSACHPAPTFASDQLFRGVTTIARYDLPRRDLDPDVSIKYIENARDGFFNANSLRGLWDRKGALFHDGRARTIRETILTPGHTCIKDGELAFNESNGQVDTNGGISHLTCDQIDDLVAYLKTIN